MGVKGNTEELVKLTALVNVRTQDVLDQFTRASQLFKELDETNVMSGNSVPSQHVKDAVDSVVLAMKRSNAILEKIADFADKLSIRVEETAHSQLAAATKAQAEDLKNSIKMTQQ